MQLYPERTDIIIACDKGQNRQIEAFLCGLGDIIPSEIYELKITKKRYKRSLDANAYMWTIADKIAEVIHDTKENVYRSAIREVGVFSDVAVQIGEPMAQLITAWSDNGIGWFVETFDTNLTDINGNKMRRIRLYKGSSRYDTKQMSRLIDYIVNEARNLGIETDTPEEIERMKVLWGEVT